MVGPMSKSPDKSPLAPGRVHASPVLIVTLILAGALGLACTYAGVMLREAGSGTTTFDLIARGDREQRTGPWRQCPARGCARRFPIPGWVAPSFDHVLGDARLRDFEPELEQFAVDAWRAPKRIFDAHPPATPCRSAAALPMGAISNTSSSESGPDANARASRVG